MYSLLTLFLVAFVIALTVTPLCRDLALRWKLLDHPGDLRKIHSRPIPRIGGVPIVLAYLASFGLVWAAGFHAAAQLQEHLPFILKLLPSAALIFAVGLADDLIGLRPWQKLAGQFVAAVMAVSAGARLTGFVGYELPMYWAVPLSVLWLVGFANAFNLIDGVDGLAAGVGLVATITTLVAALLQHNILLALATVPLAGALLGFLRYNFSPASIFLGDSGSLLIGFLLGCYGLLWSQKAATLLGITAPLIAMSIPLVDTVLAIARRFLNHQPIFGADRSHIHHKLLARGLTPRRVALIIYGVCALSACLALLQSVWKEQFAGSIVLLFCIGACVCIQRLGYTEFAVSSVRRAMQARFTPNHKEVANGEALPDAKHTAIPPRIRRAEESLPGA